MLSGIVSFILNSETIEMGESYSLLICNYLEHKIAVLFKTDVDVELNSSPHCYILISKSSSSKQLFPEACRCNTEDRERTDLRRKKVLFSKGFHSSAAV